MSDRQLAKHGARLLRLIEELEDTRHITQIEMADRLGLYPSQVSVMFRAAKLHGLVVITGTRRRRQIKLTQQGREFLERAPIDEPANMAAAMTPDHDRWQRVLLCIHGAGQHMKSLGQMAHLSPCVLHVVLRQLRDAGLVYRSYDGQRCSPAGADWLRSRGVQLAPPKKQRICLMCRQPAVEDRWYCDQHLVARYQMIATQNDGTYIAAGGQL